MLDIVNGRRERAFLRVNDALLDLACTQPRVIPNNTDDWNVDRRKDVSGGLDQDKGRDQE